MQCAKYERKHYQQALFKEKVIPITNNHIRDDLHGENSCDKSHETALEAVASFPHIYVTSKRTQGLIMSYEKGITKMVPFLAHFGYDAFVFQ